MEKMSEKKRFSLVARAKSFTHAVRGVFVFLRSTHNAWVHLFVTFIVLFLGFFFNISATEWIELIFAIGFVFVAEAFNTAIEIDMDLTSPEYHPYARDTKDVAAGAVLIAVKVAVLVGLIIFVPKFISFFS